MLTEAEKALLRDTYRRLSTHVKGFTSRYGQRQMVAAVSQTLARSRTDVETPAEGQNLLVVEGRTGVGKTFGYLVPAILMAQVRKKRLVISTATVGLQEQLFKRDLPALSTCFPKPLTYALAKGRGRHVCPARLFQLVGHGTQDDLYGDAVWDRRPEATELARLESLAREFDARRWSGDRDALDEPVPRDLWRRISTDSHGCTGQRCPEYCNCPYFKARNLLFDADVIVANHDLVLSCLSSESPLLPAPIDTIYVFDEAHHLPSIAVNRFLANTSVRDAARWVDRIGGVLAKSARYLNDNSLIANAQDAISAFTKQLDTFGSALDHAKLFGERTVFRFAHGALEGDAATLAHDLAQASNAAMCTVAKVRGAFIDYIKESKERTDACEPIMRDLGASVGRLEHANAAWAAFNTVTDLGAPPLAKWIETSKDGRDYIVSTAPITAGDVLSAHLWSAASATILTSATITTLGSFQFFLRESGLNRYRQCATLSVESPFDYLNQGTICTPKLQSDPRNAGDHSAEIVALLPSILASERAGVLVLFASRRQMEAVHEQLPEDFKADVLVQHSVSRAELIRLHVERVERGQRSILFGLAGLGEGLDLPGNLCQHVVIAKIPFAPPDSPLEEALAEWVERCGGNPFAEISLPRAGCQLIQWVGRLIRTETDKGRITLLDSRMASRSYGRQLLAGLPPMRRTSVLENVAAGASLTTSHAS